MSSLKLISMTLFPKYIRSTFSISSTNLQRLTVLGLVHDTLASLLSFSRYHFKVVLSNIVYIFSERQTFLYRVFSLDETNPVKANSVAKIDAFLNKFIISLYIIVTTWNIWFSKINITDLHLIKYCKGLI
jgi:hypothetical protein